MPDTTHTFIDTIATNAIRSDSLAHSIDSIAIQSAEPVFNLSSVPRHITATDTILPDSLTHSIDSILMQSANQVFDLASMPRHAGIPFEVLPKNESWVVLLLFAIFFFAALIFRYSQNLILENFDSFFQVKKRQSIFSKSTHGEVRIQYALTLLSLGIISFFIYVQFWSNERPFSFSTYLVILSISIGYTLLKFMLGKLIGYVFISTENFTPVIFSYNWILIYLGVGLFFITLLQTYSDLSQNLITSIGISLCLIAFVILVVKLFQIFYRKTVASFYIILYLCTLEILPLLLLLKVYNSVILTVSL
ncbi:MAG: DUF4271 domain-containing protein [Prevotellaceae bacterium]|jgi:hypothetical protein|nr:DUF4271 domain-containing protein [Prevotellaceae bacterium]